LCSPGNLIVATQKMLITKRCELCMTVICMDTFLDDHITYLYFIRTVIRFTYVMFTENLE